MSRVRPLLFASVAVALIVGAGCGSSSSSGGSSAANAGLGATTTTPPATQSTGSVGGGGSSFCSTGKADLASLRAKLASFATSSSDPQAFKSQMLTIQKAYQQAQSQAPSEIQPDMAAINTFISKLNQVFAAHQWNLLAAAPAAAPLVQNSTLKAHMNHLKAWATANCS